MRSDGRSPLPLAGGEGSQPVSIIGIVSSLPLVVTGGTLAACATILLALLSNFEAAH